MTAKQSRPVPRNDPSFRDREDVGRATSYRLQWVNSRCDCWGVTPWGTWEKKTSAPCPHQIKTTVTYTDSRNTGWNRV